MPLTLKQRGVLSGIAIAATIAILGMAGGIWLSPPLLRPDDDVASRLEFVMRWDLLVVVWLLIAIITLARHRFFTPEDIDGGGLTAGTARARIHQSVLQNTLEQVVLAAIVHIASAIVLPIEWLAIIPLAAAMFAFGRLLFWRGYHLGAPARALGFGLTFYPTALMFVILVSSVFWPA